MSRQSGRLRIAENSKSSKTQVNIQQLLGQAAEALTIASRAIGESGGLPSRSSLVKISQVNHTADPRTGTMPATKVKSNGKHAKPLNGKLSRFTPPLGNEWQKRFGRGVFRWREKQGLTLPKAALQYGIDQQIWYKVEGGNNEATTAKHVTRFEEVSGLKIEDFLKLGD